MDPLSFHHVIGGHANLSRRRSGSGALTVIVMVATSAMVCFVTSPLSVVSPSVHRHATLFCTSHIALPHTPCVVVAATIATASVIGALSHLSIFRTVDRKLDVLCHVGVKTGLN